MIGVTIILSNDAENSGKRNIFIFVFIDLKREIKEDIVFLMKAKTYKLKNSGNEGFLIKLNVVFN